MTSLVRLQINTCIAYAERSFDVIGYIPILSSTTAALRAKLALIELIIGVALTALWVLGKGYTLLKMKKENPFFMNCYLQAQEQLCYGLRNGLRSIIEAIQGMNLLLLFYDAEKAKQAVKQPLQQANKRQVLVPLSLLPHLYSWRAQKELSISES